jgi:tRNA-binding EMAP/Myf-like protein
MIKFLKKLFGIKSSCCGGCCVSTKDEAFSDADRTVLKQIDANIVVGKILEIKEHPDPKVTRVQITKCDLGNGESTQILCGGVNIVANAIVPIAKVGTKFSETFEITEREIRGEKSAGMICSREELGLSAGGDHEIWILPKTAEKFLGTALKTL